MNYFTSGLSVNVPIYQKLGNLQIGGTIKQIIQLKMDLWRIIIIRINIILI